MDDRAAAPSQAGKAGRPRKARPGKALWRGIRKPLANSRLVKNVLASLLARLLRFVDRTNPRVAGSHNVEDAIAAHTPAIAALWHGQHLLAPAINPARHRVVALFSRSADAELNALVAERLGFEVVRGSGGRENRRKVDKGGARALIALKKTIDSGCNVAMIADIPHGKPRSAGLGVVTLARLTGRPVVPIAVATSRRRVLERTWDKTTINLPFGRGAIVVGEPLFVPPDADEGEMERRRRQVTEELDRVTAQAYALVDGER